MLAYTLSHLELCAIVENALLPECYKCRITGNLMTVEFFDPGSKRFELLASGIRLGSLDTSRALSELVAKLRNTPHSLSHALAS